MRRRVLRRLSVILGWVLGITSCDGATPVYGAPVPLADFELDGKVVEAGTTLGIPGIEVQFFGTTVEADANGEWALSVDGTFFCRSECALHVRDVDGAANGAFAETSVEFSATQTGAGDGEMYEGEWEAHDITIEMEPTSGSSGS
jgi:putative lipoprotein (rSAM/lipoprotein system)